MTAVVSQNDLFVGYAVQSFNILTTGLLDVRITVNSKHETLGQNYSDRQK